MLLYIVSLLWNYVFDVCCCPPPQYLWQD